MVHKLVHLQTIIMYTNGFSGVAPKKKQEREALLRVCLSLSSQVVIPSVL